MRFLATIVAVTAVTGMATADLINPDIPIWRDDADTAFAQWDSFTSATGGPNAAEQGGGWNLYNFGSGAIIASSGNLYAAGGALNSFSASMTRTTMMPPPPIAALHPGHLSDGPCSSMSCL